MSCFFMTSIFFAADSLRERERRKTKLMVLVMMHLWKMRLLFSSVRRAICRVTGILSACLNMVSPICANFYSAYYVSFWLGIFRMFRHFEKDVVVIFKNSNSKCLQQKRRKASQTLSMGRNEKEYILWVFLSLTYVYQSVNVQMSQ